MSLGVPPHPLLTGPRRGNDQVWEPEEDSFILPAGGTALATRDGWVRVSSQVTECETCGRAGGSDGSGASPKVRLEGRATYSELDGVEGKTLEGGVAVEKRKRWYGWCEREDKEIRYV